MTDQQIEIKMQRTEQRTIIRELVIGVVLLVMTAGTAVMGYLLARTLSVIDQRAEATTLYIMSVDERSRIEHSEFGRRLNSIEVRHAQCCASMYRNRSRDNGNYSLDSN